MNGEIIALRLVHILGGIFWVGSGLFTTFFLIPALAASGPAAGQVMAALQARRLFAVLPAVALLTMLSGVRLMWIGSGGFAGAYFESGYGLTLAIAAAASVLGFLISLLIARPAALRAGQLVAALAREPAGGTRDAVVAELSSARRRGAVSSMVAVALLIVAAAGMAVARYVG